MKNIVEILSGLGIEVPEDKTKALNEGVIENYRTIADYTKQKNAAEEAQASLATLQEQVKAFEGVDVAELQGKITQLNTDMEAANAQHAAELAKRDRLFETEKFMSGKKFINDETRDYYMQKLEAALDDGSNAGKSRDELLDVMTKGEDGSVKPNIFQPADGTPQLVIPPTGAAGGADSQSNAASIVENTKKLNEHRLVK